MSKAFMYQLITKAHTTEIIIVTTDITKGSLNVRNVSKS